MTYLPSTTYDKSTYDIYVEQHSINQPMTYLPGTKYDQSTYDTFT